jgi:hypothetical protein
MKMVGLCLLWMSMSSVACDDRQKMPAGDAGPDAGGDAQKNLSSLDDGEMQRFCAELLAVQDADAEVVATCVTGALGAGDCSPERLQSCRGESTAPPAGDTGPRCDASFREYFAGCEVTAAEYLQCYRDIAGGVRAVAAATSCEQARTSHAAAQNASPACERVRQACRDVAPESPLESAPGGTAAEPGARGDRR